MKKIIVLALGLSISSAALAGAPPVEHEPFSVEAMGLGLGVGISSSEANASAGAHAGAGAYSTANGGEAYQALTNTNDSLAVNDGNNSSYINDTTALALGLSPATAAPVDTSVCRIKQTAGWDVRVVARSGRNVFDEACLKCERLFANYMRAGQTRLALAVLAREECGGEPAPSELEVAVQTVETPDTVILIPPQNDERINRMFRSLQTK